MPLTGVILFLQLKQNLGLSVCFFEKFSFCKPGMLTLIYLKPLSVMIIWSNLVKKVVMYCYCKQ